MGIQLKPPAPSESTSSVLSTGAALVSFSVALVIAGVLDVGSTIIAFQRLGGAHGEANPIFVILNGGEGRGSAPVISIICIKVVPSVLAILWLAGVGSRIPELYPQRGCKYGIVRFANLVFYGREVPWWTSLFGVPPFKRAVVFLAVPIATALVVSGVAVSITNFFGLLTSYIGLVVFWVVSAVAGFFLGIELMRRDCQRPPPKTVEQSVTEAD